MKGQPKDYQGDRSLEDMVEFVNDNAGTARRADGTVDTAYGRLPEVDKVLAQMKELNEENVAKVKEALAKIPDEMAANRKVYGVGDEEDLGEGSQLPGLGEGENPEVPEQRQRVEAEEGSVPHP